jgi:hypothetical protein
VVSMAGSQERVVIGGGTRTEKKGSGANAGARFRYLWGFRQVVSAGVGRSSFVGSDSVILL